MKQYLDILADVLDNGYSKEDRTGTGTISKAGKFFEHNMSDGFPLLTTKSVPFRLVASELEFFIKGITDKEWLNEVNNHIWDEWCSPDKVPYSHDLEAQKAMRSERDLGPIYGWQWRNFGGKYIDYKTTPSTGIDQLKQLVETLKTNPNDRRMLVMAWNPVDNNRMALPPCHYGFQCTVTGNKLNLLWNQRSCDTMAGIPFNIASYALLLHLLAKEVGLEEGRLCGFLGDVHIYSNHIEQANLQLTREPYPLCSIETADWAGLFDWSYTDTEVIDYRHHPYIKLDIAI